MRAPGMHRWNTISRAASSPKLGYLGTKGTHLDVRILPNQGTAWRSAPARYQLGDASASPMISPVGNSIFNALQIRANPPLQPRALVQRLLSVRESRSTIPPTFGGAGNTVAQNWLDIAAERGLSSFDVRHELQASFVWTSPVAGPGSHMAADSKVARLLKDWQLSGAITAQTGNPLTARVLGNTSNSRRQAELAASAPKPRASRSTRAAASSI